MCKNEKRTHGTAATGPPVAEMIASEARHTFTRGPAGARGGARVARTETPLYAFSRAIDRESLAGLGNSLKIRSKSLDFDIFPRFVLDVHRFFIGFPRESPRNFTPWTIFLCFLIKCIGCI